MGLLGAVQHYFAAFAVLSTLSAAEIAPGVTLPGYGSFSGTTVSQTLTKKPLPATVNAWLGIDYASQPVGESRFAPVGSPAEFSGWKNASAYGYACIQDPSELSYPQDEACLSMNVFRPQGISMDEKLPVLIWIHGVIFERLGLLNLGLLDQELLFKFVQQYISVFGGNPDRVTIGGRSAGAHSVGIHLFHNYNKTSGPSPLFSQAILQSGSVTARAFPDSSYPLYQTQFAQFLPLVGCGNVTSASDSAILSCLRAAPISSIQFASTLLFNESSYAITWPFQPTRGGPLLEQAGSASGINGQFYQIPTITTNVRDEAKYYTTGDLETNEQFLAFVNNLIPGLTSADLADLEALYPDPTGDVNGTYSPYAHSYNSTQYDRLSAALTDYMYACAGQETAIRMSGAGVPVHKLHFVVNNTFPDWKGVPHTADTKYTWAEPDGNSGVQYPEVGKLLHSYFADFVALGDPNAGNRTGVPKWPKYVDNNEEGLPGLQLRIEPFGNSRVEGDAIRRTQCEWWRDEARASRLQK
ncbi:putative para-nitrobenzyl esterase protein [Neofusicoccum parvum UCRNP2]|uniref:Carboxylic ester hydrolase n=1 Tax=Botryosphaeria parva (strain UCR-NP2) TaxID=1287680 RepID=R1E9P4_BOTPV|nr:putative para-nitrobenzyl esterase protein [Neofusicoccum parvum UCRNP2]